MLDYVYKYGMGEKLVKKRGGEVLLLCNFGLSFFGGGLSYAKFLL